MTQNFDTLSSATAPSRGLVQAEWLAENLSRRDIVILDSTTNIVVDEHGEERVVPERTTFLREHLPGAQFLDLQGQLSDPDSPYHFMLPDAAKFESALRLFGINNDSTVVVYSTGNPWWATRIWWMFRHFGLDNAYVLDGGLKYWKLSGYPLESGEPASRPAGDIRVGNVRSLAIDGDTLLERLNDPGLILANALPPPKFLGDEPVHGGRPGHIPGSINVPAGTFIDPDTGRFLPLESIASVLAERGLPESGAEIVAYCGGGISATQLIFALYRLDRHNVKLYDASLSEWAHRDGFPMHTSAASQQE